MLPAARRARLAEVTGQAVDSEAIATVVERRQDDYVVAVAEIGGGAERVLVHVKEAFSEQGSEPSVPAADLAALVTMEVGGELTSTQTKHCLAILSNKVAVTPRRWRQLVGLRRWIHLNLTDLSTTQLRPILARGQSLRRRRQSDGCPCRPCHEGIARPS